MIVDDGEPPPPSPSPACHFDGAKLADRPFLHRRNGIPKCERSGTSGSGRASWPPGEALLVVPRLVPRESRHPRSKSRSWQSTTLETCGGLKTIALGQGRNTNKTSGKERCRSTAANSAIRVRGRLDLFPPNFHSKIS